MIFTVPKLAVTVMESWGVGPRVDGRLILSFWEAVANLLATGDALGRFLGARPFCSGSLMSDVVFMRK